MKNNETKIGVVGLGMVGSPLARYFTELKGFERGKNLFLYDSDTRKNYVDDINNADVIFVCVPTPRNPNNNSCDTSIIDDVIRKIASPKVVVIRSTVPPGTTEGFQKKYPQHKILFNPEFLTESRAWEDMIRPDRQIVGFTNESIDAAHVVISLLPKAPFMAPWGIGTYNPVRITATEAEFIKYGANVYFARKVNWANALAAAAEKTGANYEHIRQGMAADHRIGDSHLDATHGGYRGWGGYCFPKDTAAFMEFAREKGLSDVFDLLKADWEFNERLLNSQGLTIEAVSKHITHEDMQKLNKKNGEAKK